MSYYLLEQDLRIPDIAAVGAVPDSIEPLDWIHGKKMAPPPGVLRLPLSRASGELRTDLMGTLLTLFSDDLRDAMTRFGVDNIDYFPVELEHPVTRVVETGYWLANILGLVRCLDTARSTIVPRPSGARGRLASFHIDPVLAAGFDVFRLAEQPTLIILSQPLRTFLMAEPLAGVRMRHTRVYNGR